jgi:hypothetical protein
VEEEIRQQLEAYLRGALSLEEFRSWLLERTWDNPSVPKIAHEVEFLIDEAALGGLSRKQMDARLSSLVHSGANLRVSLPA